MVKMLAYPVMVLSGIGVMLCLSFYLLGVTGIYPLPAKETPVLFGGLFVVWIPTVILANRLTQDFKQRDFWKAALRGCPAWMRAALWVVIGCVFAVFFLPVLSKRSPGIASIGISPVETICTLPHNVLFGLRCCVMYSLINVQRKTIQSAGALTPDMPSRRAGEVL